MLELGSQASDFKLFDTNNNKVSLSSFNTSKGYLIMFICNHCPYVIHLQGKLAQICKEYKSSGIAVFAINSNDSINYPEDNLSAMKKQASKLNFTFPYLIDDSQEVAKAYKAACTPDFFLFDAQKKLVYRGQMDDSRPGNDKPINGHCLTKAVNALLKDQEPLKEQSPSLGCNIKWRTGNEPRYFSN